MVKVTTDDFDPSLQGCKTPYALVLSKEHLQQRPSNAVLFQTVSALSFLFGLETVEFWEPNQITFWGFKWKVSALDTLGPKFVSTNSFFLWWQMRSGVYCVLHCFRHQHCCLPLLSDGNPSLSYKRICLCPFPFTPVSWPFWWVGELKLCSLSTADSWVPCEEILFNAQMHSCK